MAGDERMAEQVPVAIFDRSGGVWVFHSDRDAARWMEAVDVADGEYHGYDADGYVLSLSTDGDDVLVRRTSEQAYEEAAHQLRDALSRSPVTVAEGPLREMIHRLLQLEDSSGMRPRVAAILKGLRDRLGRT